MLRLLLLSVCGARSSVDVAGLVVVVVVVCVGRGRARARERPSRGLIIVGSRRRAEAAGQPYKTHGNGSSGLFVHDTGVGWGQLDVERVGGGVVVVEQGQGQTWTLGVCLNLAISSVAGGRRPGRGGRTARAHDDGPRRDQSRPKSDRPKQAAQG